MDTLPLLQGSSRALNAWSLTCRKYHHGKYTLATKAAHSGDRGPTRAQGSVDETSLASEAGQETEASSSCQLHEVNPDETIQDPSHPRYSGNWRDGIPQPLADQESKRQRAAPSTESQETERDMFHDLRPGRFGMTQELINGRAALLGFVAAVAAEQNAGYSLLDQVKSAPMGILLTVALITVASVYEYAEKPSRQDSKSEQTPERVERVSGRIAMLAMSGLMIKWFLEGGR